MSNKGTAYALALAIYAGNQEACDVEDTGYRIYKTLDKSSFGSDEVKADVYAQLAEQLTATTTFERAVNIIEAALDSTEQSLKQRIS